MPLSFLTTTASFASAGKRAPISNSTASAGLARRMAAITAEPRIDHKTQLRSDSIGPPKVRKECASWPMRLGTWVLGPALCDTRIVREFEIRLTLRPRNARFFAAKRNYAYRLNPRLRFLFARQPQPLSLFARHRLTPGKTGGQNREQNSDRASMHDKQAATPVVQTVS
jgi:hypothetical protein